MLIIVSIAVAGVVLSQIMWLNSAWDLSHDREEQRVELALQKSADQLIYLQNISIPDSLNSNESLSYIKNMLDSNLISSILKREMAHIDLSSGYAYSIINVETNQRLLYVDNLKKSRKRGSEFAVSISCIKNPHPFVLKYYTKLNPAYVLNRLKFWLFFSIFLISVIFTLFVRTIIVLRKEKEITSEKMDFVKNLIHEYKTPIATIGMSSDILLKQHKDSEDKRLLRYLNIIKDENSRLRQLVEKLLGMTVLDRSDLTLSKEHIDLHHLIRRAVETLSIQMEQAGAQLELNLMAKVSSVYVDPVHMMHVLTNLLDNALKYSDEKPMIYISTDNETKKQIRLEICDNGVGIPSDQQKQIFNQFYRGAQHKKSGKSGFGLGLYYVKKMITQHNGKVLIESVPEQGSCFSVYLPITEY